MLNPALFILPVWKIVQIIFVKRQMPKQHCPGKCGAFRNEKCQYRLVCPSIRQRNSGNHPTHAQVTADVLFTFVHDKISFLFVQTPNHLCVFYAGFICGTNENRWYPFMGHQRHSFILLKQIRNFWSDSPSKRCLW